jgi:hypothetical protein
VTSGKKSTEQATDCQDCVCLQVLTVVQRLLIMVYERGMLHD